MGGTPDAKMRVTQYHASIHYGICHGPLDNISRISVQEKEAWAGVQLAQGGINISKMGLFGGTKKEGGVEGIAYYFPGNGTQTVPDILAAKAGRTSATMPAYRGIASLWFYGRKFLEPRAQDEGDGFYWGANNPYLPGVWAKVSRTSVGLDPSNARIGEDSNPAHIIYECLTNTSWGMGASSSIIDVGSFLRAASVLYSEAFGLSLLWTQQTTIEAFVSEILDHIEAVLFVSPRTGLLTLKLIRDQTGQVIDLNSVSNAATSAAAGLLAGVTITAHPNQTLTFSLPTGQTYVAWSPWGDPSPANPGNSGTVHSFWVIRDGDTTDVTAFGNEVVYSGYEAARAAFPGGTISGGSSYTFYIQDTPTGDNTGGLSIFIETDFRVFTPLNSTVTNFSRKLWGETVNEIVVTWTNPNSEEEETVVAQDLANIAMQGGIVSDSRNYYGVRNSSLAMKLAQRDLRSGSTPLASCQIEVNREAWDLEPGDICILDSPEDGIEALYMRVGPVDYGHPGDAVVRASLIEDVFSLGSADYTDPPATEAEDTSELPTPADYTLILTASYWSVLNGIDPAISNIEYPEVFAGVLATEDGPDTLDFDLYGEVVDAGGNTTVEDIGTKTIASRSELPDPLAAEVESTIFDFGTRTRGNGPSVGGFVLLEGADETEHELCLVLAFDDTSPTFWTLRRGVLDTTPKAWPVGTPVWFIDDSSVWLDQTVRAAGETVNYQILPRTSMGQLAIGDAPIVSETLTGRPHLPARPAGVTIDLDDGFSGSIDLVGVDPIPVAFARRNRLTEDTLILAWDDGDVTPEAGQTTTVRLTDIDDNIVHEYTGIAGTSQNVDPADFGDVSQGYIITTAVRDGLESLQPHRVHVILSYAFEFEDGDVFEFEDGERKDFEDL